MFVPSHGEVLRSSCRRGLTPSSERGLVMGNIVRTIATACGMAVACLAVAAGPDAGRGVVAVLELPDGGFVRGTLAERPEAAEPAATLAWKSQLFATPIEFGIEGVRRVRFSGPAADPPAADAWRCELDGGDALIGRLKGIDADHVTLVSAGDDGQEWRVRRAAVARLARVGAGDRVLVPGPLEAWQASAGDWTAIGGRVASAKKGATAHLPLELPQRVRYDLELSWDERPELVVAFAADAKTLQAGRKPSKTAEEFRIELAGDSLLAVRESAKAEFDPIADIPADARRLRIVVFVDRDAGRMAVVMPAGGGQAGKQVFDKALPPRAKPPAGVSVKLTRGNVRIDGLTVSEWTEPQPVTADRPLPAVEGFDPATGEFMVRDAAGARSLPAAQVVAATVRAEGPLPVDRAAGRLQAVFKDGGRITGRLLAVTTDGVVLACPSLAAPLRLRFDRLATLEPADPGRPPALAGTRGTLQGTEARIPGAFANAVDGEAVGWLAAGAAAPVRFAARLPVLRVEFPPPTSGKSATPTKEAPALVYLRTGDSFLCKVLACDPAALRVATAVAAETVVPAEAWRAVELTPGKGSTVAREKQARLLTLPRMQKADPPTHLLRLQSGDYVRGKLVSVDEKLVRFEVLDVVKEFPRADVMRLIWLAPPGGGPRPEIVKPDEANGLPVQALTGDGRRLTFAAREVVEGGGLNGRHAVLGPTGIALDSCATILVGEAAIAATPVEALPYGQWVLKVADEPRALRPKPGPEAEAENPAKPGPPTAEPADPAEAEALAAAEAAVNAFDPRCLEMLGDLLDAKSVEIRKKALAVLRRLTGRSTRELPLNPADPPDKRRADVLRWRQWIAQEGLFAELAFPRPVAVKAGLLGRTLFSVPSQDVVVEVDDQGKETFRVAAVKAYACDLLPNGHRLVGDGKGVVEYDAQGKEVWSKKDLPRAPMSVRRLDNGNTLVTMDGYEAEKMCALEIDPLGDEVWRWSGDQPGDAERLPNGNTLVALHGANRVVEVDAEGQEVWGVAIEDPLRVERLADGTTLVVSGANHGRIYGQDGSEVRDLGEMRDARVAPDGGLMILGMDGLLQREDQGKQPLRIQLPEGAGRFRRR